MKDLSKLYNILYSDDNGKNANIKEDIKKITSTHKEERIKGRILLISSAVLVSVGMLLVSLGAPNLTVVLSMIFGSVVSGVIAAEYMDICIREKNEACDNLDMLATIISDNGVKVSKRDLERAVIKSKNVDVQTQKKSKQVSDEIENKIIFNDCQGKIQCLKEIKNSMLERKLYLLEEHELENENIFDEKVKRI